MNWLKWYFDWTYRFSKPRWDSGVTPPEVTSLIESGSFSGKRALDLGCGTGTNAIYLAQHGMQVVGVDFSPKAIAMAAKKSQAAGLQIAFHVGDVTHLDFLDEPFDYVLDIGCFHGVPVSKRTQYAENIERLTRAGSVFQLYCFAPRKMMFQEFGATPEQVSRLFERNFVLDRVDQGEDRGASAWYWFKRK